MSESLQNVQQLTGEALAAAVAERVMGWESFTVQDVQCFTPSVNSSKVVRADTFRPDRDIAQAWEIHQAICNRLYSVRLRYCTALQSLASDIFFPNSWDGVSKILVAWPNVLFYLTPEIICRAALAAVESGRHPPFSVRPLCPQCLSGWIGREDPRLWPVAFADEPSPCPHLSVGGTMALKGEALAAAVAEKVMGWSRVSHSERWFNDDDTAPWVRDFRPDRDIAQAIAALEHLAGRKHWSWCIYRSDGTVAGPLYEVEITHAGKSHFGFSPLDGDGADSLPTAICKAALKAVEAANA